jgi:hypothetical protein
MGETLRKDVSSGVLNKKIELWLRYSSSFKYRELYGKKRKQEKVLIIFSNIFSLVSFSSKIE